MNAFLDFSVFIYFAHVSDLVDTILVCGLFVPLKCSVHVPLSVHLIKLERVQCSISSFPNSALHSAEHLSDSARELYQCDIRSYFCLVIACTVVVIGSRCYVDHSLCVCWIRCMWSCPISFFGGGCFGSSNCYFSLHSFSPLIKCRCFQIVKVKLMRQIGVHIGSYILRQ